MTVLHWCFISKLVMWLIHLRHENFKSLSIVHISCWIVKACILYTHILLWLQTKLWHFAVDTVICTKFTHPKEKLLLYVIIWKHIVHGSCGHFNAHFPCMTCGKCTKDIPEALDGDASSGFWLPIVPTIRRGTSWRNNNNQTRMQ